MNHKISLQAKVVRGGFWISLGYALQQGLAVVRTFVLARLLTPEDFGIIGLTVLILFAGNILAELNIGSALIQKPKLTERFINTAWSISLSKGILLAVSLIGLAPNICEIMKSQIYLPYLRVGAINFILVSIPAVPMALLMRHFMYKKRVFLDISRELVTVSLSIILALWLHNAWSLLLGFLGGDLFIALGVWFVCSYRPRWGFDRKSLSELWKFGIPLYISGLITYLVTRGDDLVVSKLKGIRDLGQYQVVFNIAEMLTRGLSDVISRVVFPAYSKLVNDNKDLQAGFAEVWHVLVLLILPVAGVVVVFPSEMIHILLGNQWLSAAPALMLLMIGESLRAMCVPFGIIIISSGNTSHMSRIKLLEAIVFSILIVPLTHKWGIEGAAACLIIVYSFVLVGSVYMANKVASILQLIINGIWEPLLITIIIALFASKIQSPNILAAIIIIVAWVFCWVIYVVARHSELVCKIFWALRKDAI